MVCELELNQGPLRQEVPLLPPIWPRVRLFVCLPGDWDGAGTALLASGHGAQKYRSFLLMGLPFATGFLCFLGKFEKDSTEYLKHLEPRVKEECWNLHKGNLEEDAECPDPLPLGGLFPEERFSSLDLCFLQEFIFKLLKSKSSSSALS